MDIFGHMTFPIAVAELIGNSDSTEVVRNVLFPVSRWLHMVSMTLLVGGTLFYELVVPIAIEDLKQEQQLYVFARARWVFRRVVILSAILLIITGVVSALRLLDYYEDFHASRYFVMTHIGGAVVSLIIALILTVGRRPPTHAVWWMRFNLVILLSVIFLAGLARHARLTILEQNQITRLQLEEKAEQLGKWERDLDDRETRLAHPVQPTASQPASPVTQPSP